MPTVSTCSGVTRAHRRTVLVAVVGLYLPRDRLQLRLRLIARRARTQAADHAQVVVVPPVARRGLDVDRRPDLDARHERIVEGVGKHRHHLLAHTVDRQRLSNRIRARAEILPPDSLGDDDHVGSGALVVASERPAGQRLHAEDAEIVGPDRHDGDALGLRAIGQVRAFTVVGVDRREIERRAPVPERAESRPGHVAVGLARHVIDADEAVRVVIGQRPEHDRVQHAEHCRVRSQPERERQDDDRGELPRRPQRSYRVGDVSCPAPHVAPFGATLDSRQSTVVSQQSVLSPSRQSESPERTCDVAPYDGLPDGSDCMPSSFRESSSC